MTTVSRLIHFFIVLTCACLIAVVILISRFDSVAAQNSPLGWPDDYRLMPGNLHSHTKYSDGKDVLDDVLDNVIKSNPNYVLGITDHVEQLDDGEWRELLSKTTRASSLNWQKSSFIAL